jgi:photosystem II stability/assembly factor-like uncharacterized protein
MKKASYCLLACFIIFLLSKCSMGKCPKKDEVNPVPPTSTSSEIMSWTVKNVSITTNLLSDYFTDDNTGYLCGVGGFIYKTTDGANSLTLLNSGTTQNLYSICFKDANTGFAVGDGNTILRTTDAGVTWTPVSPPASVNYRKVFFLDANIGFISGGVGTLLKTADGGLSWTLLNTGTSVDLHGIFFTDANTGYISGQYYTMLKTTNGGNSWNLVNTGLTGNSVTPLTSIYFTDVNTGYAVGGFSYSPGTGKNAIIKTTDGGATWSQQSNPDTTNVFYSVKFIDSNIGYIAGADLPNSAGVLLKTTNGGVTWIKQAISTPRLSCISLVKSGMGFAVGYNGTILNGNF